MNFIDYLDNRKVYKTNICMETMNESYHNTYKINGYDIEIFKNPSKYEPDEFINEVRAILTTRGDLYTWSGGTTVMHISISKKLNINLSDMINLSLFIYRDKNLVNISFYDVRKDIRKNIDNKDIKRLKDIVINNKNIKNYMLEGFSVGTENLVMESYEPGQSIHNEIKEESFAVITKTLDEWYKVQKWANENGIKWSSGENTLGKEYFKQYKDIKIEITNKMLYGSYSDYKTYSFEDFEGTFLS